MAVVDGALAGLSLLHDEPNYRVSQPTKVIEYLAHGVPVDHHPAPPRPATGRGGRRRRRGAVRRRAADPDAVLALDADPDTRARMGRLGHAHAREQLDWTLRSREFVSRMGAIAGAPRV